MHCVSVLELHNYLWCSSGYMLIISALSLLIGFLPIMKNFGGIGSLEDEEQRANQLVGLHSSELRMVQVASIGLSVPVALDFFLDILHRLVHSNFNDVAIVPRFALVCSLVVPNILLLVFETESIETADVIFATRMICIWYGTLGHLWIMGGDFFKTKVFMSTYFFYSAGIVIMIYDIISKKQGGYLFWIAVTTCCISVAVLFFIFIQYFLLIKKAGFQNMTIPQVSCVMYMIILSALLGVVGITTVNFVGNYGAQYNLIYTYAESGCTLLLTALQSRLLRMEINEKEVRNLINY